MRTHWHRQLKLDFDRLPNAQPSASTRMQLSNLMVPPDVAAAFARRSEASLTKARKEHGLEHARTRQGRILYSVGGLVAFCERRGHVPDWSALAVVQPLDAGRRLAIAATVGRRHIAPPLPPVPPGVSAGSRALHRLPV